MGLAGTSLHEIAHVILAADFSGQAALSIGLLGKLGRVFLLIPLSIILILIMRFKSQGETEKRIDVLIFTWFCHDGTVPYLCAIATHGYANYR